MSINHAHGAALAAVFACLISAPSYASIINFTSFLSPENEVPPVASEATGGAGIVFVDASSNLLAWSIAFEGLTGPAAFAHFHSAPAGVNGPIEINLDTGENTDDVALNATIFSSGIGSTSGIFQGNGQLSAAQTADLLTHNLYVNIHTEANPGGEIRGQVLRAQVIPVPATIWLFGTGLLGLAGIARRR